MSRPTPEDALERYLQDAKNRGDSFKQMSAARHFLRLLLSALKNASADGAGYRMATEETGRIIPEESRPAFILAVREYYPYWNGEVKEGAPGSTPAPAVAAQPRGTATLNVATPIVATEQAVAAIGSSLGTGFTSALATMEVDAWARQSVASLERQLLQMRSLAAYAEELKSLGLSEENQACRIRYMKLLLYTIRDDNQNTEVYRLGVDKVLPLLPQDRWQVFVSLAREFFYFLASAPNAASKLNPGISDDEVLSLTKP